MASSKRGESLAFISFLDYSRPSRSCPAKNIDCRYMGETRTLLEKAVGERPCYFGPGMGVARFTN